MSSVALQTEQYCRIVRVDDEIISPPRIRHPRIDRVYRLRESCTQQILASASVLNRIPHSEQRNFPSMRPSAAALARSLENLTQFSSFSSTNVPTPRLFIFPPLGEK